MQQWAFVLASLPEGLGVSVPERQGLQESVPSVAEEGSIAGLVLSPRSPEDRDCRFCSLVTVVVGPRDPVQTWRPSGVALSGCRCSLRSGCPETCLQ